MGIFSHGDECEFRFIDQLQRGWQERKQVAIYRGTSVDAKNVLLVPSAAVIKSHSKAMKDALLLVDRYEVLGERLFKPTEVESLPEDEVAGQAEKSAETPVAPHNAAEGA